MQKTLSQFDVAVNSCRDIFIKKMHDYGTAWRILRVNSITDQIFIKAQRIRSIEEKGSHKVNEGVEAEFPGIIIYSIFALTQLELRDTKLPPSLDDVKNSNLELSKTEVIRHFDLH